MSCQRAEEIDLTAFLAERRGDEWAAFRDHYPRCAECSRAVAELSALESALREAGGAAGSGSAGPAHVHEDDLLAYADGALEPARRASLETHLEGCPACRSELAVLQRFDPAEALAPLASHAEAGDPIAAPHAASAQVVPVPLGSRLRGWLEEWLAPVPAFALAAAAAVVALGVVWAVAFQDPGEPAPRLVEREPPRSERGPEAPAPETALPGPETGSGDAGTQLAEERPGPALGSESEGAAGPSSPSAAPDASSPRPEQLAAGPEEAGASGDDRRGEAFEEDEPSERLAERDASPDPGERASDTTPSAEPEGDREVVLLAALLPSELPRYALPPDLEGAGLGLVRSGAGLRGGADAAPRVSVLAPEHVGLTTSPTPTLHWVLDRESSHPVELIVTDPDADEPLLEKRLAPPVAAGAHALDLAAEGVSLDPGTAYVWSAAVVLDEEAREADVVSMGAVRFERAPEGAQPRSAEAAAGAGPEAAQARRVHRLAEGGYWYDAYTQLSRWIAQHPEVERLERYRRGLLEQIALGESAEWIAGGASGSP